MKTKELKELQQAIRESASRRVEAAHVTCSSMRDLTTGLQCTEKLSRKNNRSILIKAGLALIAFPDPTISDVVGAGLVAAGLIQTKMKNSALYLEDVYKTFPQVFKELNSIKNGLK